MIANVKLEFDDNGKIKKNYKIDGLIKDVKLSFLKKYNIQKLDLIFEYKDNNLSTKNIKFSLNNFNFLSEKISFKKVKNNFLIQGNLNHKLFDFEEKNLNFYIKPLSPKLDIKSMKFISDTLSHLKSIKI